MSKERILKYIENKGVSKYKFYKETGLSNGALGKKGNFGADKYELICSCYPDINPEWLLTGKGSMLREESNQQPPVVIDKRPIIEVTPQGSNKDNCYIADVKAAAGVGELINTPTKLKELPSLYIPNAPDGLNFAFEINGDSMGNTISNGDYVAANYLQNPHDTIRSGYVHVVVDKDDGVICKRIYKEDNRLRIVSDNPIYDEYYRNFDDIIGVFKAFFRWSTDFRSYNDDIRSKISVLELEIINMKKRL